MPIALLQGLLFFLLPLVAGSQSIEQEPASEKHPPDDVIDEITVVAPRAVISIRADIIHVEEEMFDVFNALNTDRDFHVVCGWDNRNTGNPTTVSRLKDWQCQSMFEKNILSRALGGVGGIDAIARAQALQSVSRGAIRRHREEMRKKVIELAQDSPELTNLVYRRAALEQDLAAARKRDQE